jgi:hypothetical protein
LLDILAAKKARHSNHKLVGAAMPRGVTSPLGKSPGSNGEARV